MRARRRHGKPGGRAAGGFDGYGLQRHGLDDQPLDADGDPQRRAGGRQQLPGVDATVSVAANAPASVINTATVSGGGELNTTNDTATEHDRRPSGHDLYARWSTRRRKAWC